MSDGTGNPLALAEAESTSPYISLDSKRLHHAAERAMDYYLKPSTSQPSSSPRKSSTVFVVAPDVNPEALLAQACESLASASVMASDFAALLDGAQRNTMMALQQIIMLGELAVNRMLDNVEPPQPSRAGCSSLDT
ncbi:DUF6124 family protein [Pseudomonas migulae]